MWKAIGTFIIKRNESINLTIKIIGQFNVAVAIFMLIYRYGFILNDQETRDIFYILDWQFLIYLINFSFRLLFSYNRSDFLKEERFELVLASLIAVYGMANYFFGFKIILYYFQLFSAHNPEVSYQHFLSICMVIIIILGISRGANSVSELKLKPAVTFVMSFVILILGGALLLMLPAMTTQGSMDFIDALFTSASASCVTGLIVVDTATFFTFKGKLVLMLLIQLGGLGIVLFATFFSSFLSSGVSLKQQSIMQDFLSSENLASAKELLRKVVFITILVESIGFVLIFFSWDEELWDAEQQFKGLGDKIFHSAFHAISAFCNAGFSTFTDGMYNLELKTQRMYAIHFILAWLVIFGGLGFTVIEDIFHPKNIRKRYLMPWKKLTHNTNITIKFTFILVVLGTVAFMIFEFNQLRDRTIIESFITAFFQSVITRTAGFNSLDFATLQNATIVLCIFLMFIGAGSGSTAGGIKVTTFVVILYSSIANISGQKNINIDRRNIPTDIVNRAFAILMFAVSYNSIAIFLLSITESEKDILKVVFEQISAFATVGVSMGITAKLSALGKLIITLTMFVGRVGTVTLALALSKKAMSTAFEYPKTHLLIG
ncbi:MAG: Trk-type K+ transporter membrane component [Cytophagales bacterium]|nr:MAG: Trk-type K+ transporter membrane component [Cytophagales bacterium]